MINLQTKLVLSFIFIIYFIYGASSYFDKFKVTPYYFILAISVAVIGNVLWAYFSSRTLTHNSTLKLAIYWDLAVTVSFLSAGLFFGNTNFGLKHIIGILMIITGSILIK